MPNRIQTLSGGEWTYPTSAVDIRDGTIWANPFIGEGDWFWYKYWAENDVTLAGCQKAIDSTGFVTPPALVRTGLDPKKKFAELKDLVKRELKGKNLVCCCQLDRHCHGDLLLKLAN